MSDDDMSWLDSIVTPRIGVVAIVESRDRERLLLIRRKFAPLGLAFSGGFMEMGETIARTAIREVAEERSGRTTLPVCWM
jgi:ADP-ribose pyrophosphatase YjhB (NUDIX family)